MKQGCFPEIAYSEFVRPINKRLARERIPICGTIELTHRCNLRCHHCYCNLPIGNRRAKERELSLERHCRLIDEIAARDCLWVLFTGGEPFVREDFPELYLYAKKKGMLVSVFTNGTLVTEKIAAILGEWPPRELEVTLYGATEKTYELVTGVEGSFERCLNGIRMMRDAGVAVKLKTMVTTLNKEELGLIREFAAGIGTAFRFDYVLQSRIDGSQGLCRYRIDPDEAATLDMSESERRKGWANYLERARRLSHEEAHLSCGAGRDSFFVDPYGKVSVCSMYLSEDHDLTDRTFGEIWDEGFPDAFTKGYLPNPKCNGCEAVFFCDNCVGWAMTECGDPEGVAEYLCAIAHARKRAFHNREETR